MVKIQIPFFKLWKQVLEDIGLVPESNAANYKWIFAKKIPQIRNGWKNLCNEPRGHI